MDLEEEFSDSEVQFQVSGRLTTEAWEAVVEHVDHLAAQLTEIVADCRRARGPGP